MSILKLLLSDVRGIYIPQKFYCVFNLSYWNINSDTVEGIDDLSSPENDFYWDTWEIVLNNAFFIDKDGHKWTLYQDVDLWAICDDLMTDEEKYNFGFDE